MTLALRCPNVEGELQMDERAASERRSVRRDDRAADRNAIAMRGEGEEEEMSTAVLVDTDATSQNPVSIIGWAGTLALGAAIWMGLAALL